MVRKRITLSRGWKGYVGGALLVAIGLYLMLTGNEIEGGQAIALGLGILGIRHYLQYSKED